MLCGRCDHPDDCFFRGCALRVEAAPAGARYATQSRERRAGASSADEPEGSAPSAGNRLGVAA